MKVIQGNKETIVIIENLKDIKKQDACKGFGIEILFIPKSIKEAFLLSEFRTAILPCINSKNGKIYYYE